MIYLDDPELEVLHEIFSELIEEYEAKTSLTYEELCKCSLQSREYKQIKEQNTPIKNRLVILKNLDRIYKDYKKRELEEYKKRELSDD